METGIVYCLCEPDSMDPRYVGATRKTLSERTQEHIASCKNGEKPIHAWVRQLLERGEKPKAIVLYEIKTAGFVFKGISLKRLLGKTERDIIRALSKKYDLLNIRFNEKLIYAA